MNWGAYSTPWFRKRLAAYATGQRRKMDLGALYLNLNLDPTGPQFNAAGQTCNIVRPSAQGYERKLIAMPGQPAVCKFKRSYNSTTGKTEYANAEEIHFDHCQESWNTQILHWMIETSSGEVCFFGRLNETNPPTKGSIICIPVGAIKITL